MTPQMDSMVKVRLSRARWQAVQDVAKQEKRSATAQLGLILDRGMGGRAGYEIAILAENRTKRLMGEAHDGV